jgi:hypothetical protein
MFKQQLNWSDSMLIHLDNVIPGLPPLSVVTVVGMSMVAVGVVLYLINHSRELLLISAIAFIYGIVPLMH